MSKCAGILTVMIVMGTVMACAAQPFVGKGGKYFRKGLKVVASESRMDTMFVEDPVTTNHIMKVRVTEGGPDSVNGKKAYNYQDITTIPQTYSGKTSLEEYVMKNLKKEMESLQLPDGTIKIDLHRVVVDEKGKVVYYELGSVYHTDKNGSGFIVNETFATKISKLMETAPIIKPGNLNGKKVTAFTDHGALHFFEATIHNHVVTYKKH